MPLLTRKTSPPGHWRYQQLDNAGKPFKYFNNQGSFNDITREILVCREGNSLARPTIEEVRDDVDAYQCERLGNDRRYCTDTSGPTGKALWDVPGNGGGCSHCGGQAA